LSAASSRATPSLSLRARAALTATFAAAVALAIVAATARSRPPADPADVPAPSGAAGDRLAPAFLQPPRAVLPVPPRSSLDRQPAPSPLVVTYRRGTLAILARDATLDEILGRVAQATGAEIEAPALNERISVKLGPQVPAQVIADLLGELHLNYAMQGGASRREPVRSIIVIPEGGGASRPVAPLEDPAIQERIRQQRIGETGGDEGVFDTDDQNPPR